MAGTDHKKPSVIHDDGPAIILIVPQLGENIGKAVRAMYNFGLTDLRLVAPRDGWPNEAAVAPAAGADIVLEKTRVYPTTAEAIADLKYVYATTARPRDMIKEVVTPKECCLRMRGAVNEGEISTAIVSVPLNPSFASINLATAVGLLAYEWFQTGTDVPDSYTPTLDTRPASAGELQKLFDHIEGELEEAGYFRSDQRRSLMRRNLRNIFTRSEMTHEEVSTMRGVVKALSTGGGPGWQAEKAELAIKEQKTAENGE